MSAQPPFNGELGTDDRPTAISTDVLELLTTGADSLVGLGFDAAETDDGVIVFDGESGDFSNAVAWVDGTAHPVTSVEWVDSSGTARPVTEWHLGPRSFFAVTITGTNSPVTAGETLTISADITNTGATTASDTIFLQRAAQTYDAVTVSDLPSGATTSITLSWDTQSGDKGEYTFEVASSDDTASQTVTVESSGPTSEADDKLVYRWFLSDVGTGTVESSVGNLTGQVNGVSSVSGDYIDGAAADGNDDFFDDANINFGSPTDFFNQLDGGFAFAFTVDSLTTTSEIPIFEDSNSDHIFDTFVNIDSADRLAFTLGVLEGPDNTQLAGIDVKSEVSPVSFTDGNQHRIVVVFNAGSPPTVDFYVDKTEAPVAKYKKQEQPVIEESVDFSLFGEGGVVFPDTIDDLCLYGDSLTQSEVDSYELPGN